RLCLFSDMTSLALCSLYFFFFQAEDGIRDRNVTGVQTCALPISAMEESGVEINWDCPVHSIFRAWSHSTPSTSSRSSTLARNGAEFSPIPAVKVMAWLPPTATW